MADYADRATGNFMLYEYVLGGIYEYSLYRVDGKDGDDSGTDGLCGSHLDRP